MPFCSSPRKITPLVFFSVFLILTALTLSAQELPAPEETNHQVLSDMVKRLTSRMGREALPLLDRRLSPARKAEVTPLAVDSEITGAMVESLNRYYQGLTDPPSYLVDTVTYLTDAWEADEFTLSSVPADSYLAYNSIYIEDKFIPGEGGKTVVSLDLVKRFQESPDSTLGFLIQLSKHYYDHHHNSIGYFFNQRNIREEFLYFRDALLLQLEVVEPLLDTPGNELTSLEKFYMDSKYQDQLSSVFMLQMGLDQELFFFLREQTDKVIANPREVLSYLQGLRRMHQSLADLAFPEDPFQKMILGHKLTSFWIFQGWFFMEMAQRVPVYGMPEARAEAREVVQAWLALGDRILPLQDDLFRGREQFIARFYDETE